MQGMEVCARHFDTVGLPMLAAHFPAHIDRIAAGLVGTVQIASGLMTRSPGIMTGNRPFACG
jgi:hypothetical protein